MSRHSAHGAVTAPDGALLVAVVVAALVALAVLLDADPDPDPGPWPVPAPSPSSCRDAPFTYETAGRTWWSCSPTP